MMKVLWIQVLLVLVADISLAQVARKYDLDSLYENDFAFEEYFDSIREDFSIFEDEEPLKVILKSDFKQLNKKKFNKEYQDAELTAFIGDSLFATRTLKIQTRGKSRLSTCYYPPLKLNFKKGDMLLKQFKEFDKVKLVKPCKSGDTYEDYLVNELLIYKLYQIIEPDFSFRVRRLIVTYIDTSEKLKTRTVPSFIIESNKELGERTNSINIESEGLTFRSIDRFRADLMSVFQFMIGNTDWSVPALHNTKLFTTKDPLSSTIVAVPYDFDYAGIVNASYAVPAEALDLASVRERQYRGFCGSEGDIESAIEVFKERKQELLRVYNDATFKREKYKEATIKYLNEFFTIIENDKRAKSQIINRCR